MRFLALPKVAGDMYSDPIADLLTRIRNGYQAFKFEVRAPYSRTKEAILEVLSERNFIESYKIEGEGAKKTLVTVLKYGSNRKPAIETVNRISKPGLRVYKKSHELGDILGGFGVAIVSTSQGMMTAREAKKKNLGGEVLAEVW